VGQHAPIAGTAAATRVGGPDLPAGRGALAPAQTRTAAWLVGSAPRPLDGEDILGQVVTLSPPPSADCGRMDQEAGETFWVPLQRTQGSGPSPCAAHKSRVVIAAQSTFSGGPRRPPHSGGSATPASTNRRRQPRGPTRYGGWRRDRQARPRPAPATRGTWLRASRTTARLRSGQRAVSVSLLAAPAVRSPGRRDVPRAPPLGRCAAGPPPYQLTEGRHLPA